MKSDLYTLTLFSKDFLFDPLNKIKTLPKIDWPALLVFQVSLHLVLSLLSWGISPTSTSIGTLASSALASLLAMGLVTLFFYYFFLILFSSRFSFQSLYILVLFAHLPFAVFHIASFLFPPTDLIGFGLSGMLMTVGLVENFRVPVRLGVKILIGLYVIFILFWTVALISRSGNLETSPENKLDSIEQEIKNSLKTSKLQ